MSVFKQSNTALITGGASGIGLAVAKLCRKHGMKVGIVDVTQESLSCAKEALQSNGSPDEVETYNVDVSKAEQWEELKSKFESKFGEPDLLMLNAGVGAKGTWGDDAYFHKVSPKWSFLGAIVPVICQLCSFHYRSWRRTCSVLSTV